MWQVKIGLCDGITVLELFENFVCQNCGSYNVICINARCTNYLGNRRYLTTAKTGKNVSDYVDFIDNMFLTIRNQITASKASGKITQDISVTRIVSASNGLCDTGSISNYTWCTMETLHDVLNRSVQYIVGLSRGRC